MDKIKYYKFDGTLDHEELLSEDALAGTNGMLIRCHMNDGTIEVGYSDPYRTHVNEEWDGEVHDYIYLWTWDNIDEETHKLIGDDKTKYNQTFRKIIINKINTVDAILYSNPKWGGKLTNKFEFSKSKFAKNTSFSSLNSEENRYDFEYKDDKYDIIGFIANPREMEQYNFKKVFGGEADEYWIFNINNNLICFSNSGNYHLDGYSVIIDGDYMNIVTDFDYYKINLKSLEEEIHLEPGTEPCNEIYKFYNGFVIIGEMGIDYIEKDKIVWEYGTEGIIEFAIVCKDDTIEVHEIFPHKVITLNKNGKKI